MNAEAKPELFGKLKWKYFLVGFVVLTLAGLSFAIRSYLAIMKQGVNGSRFFLARAEVDFLMFCLNQIRRVPREVFCVTQPQP
ncbi:MAG TPA: hypothetical protein VF556_12890 [Pyrinomonadaceae bacterium]|jgi:hypothetical protein